MILARTDFRARVVVCFVGLLFFSSILRYSDYGKSRRWARAKASVVNGPPTASFRDNLRNDTLYITSWPGAGFTNQFMGYANMIYVATLTDRVPILPPFAPYKIIGDDAGLLPFGDVFDLEYLSSQLRTPVLEWRDVKDLPPTTGINLATAPLVKTDQPEALGCWSTRIPTEQHAVRSDRIVQHLGIDASYTRVPPTTRLEPDPIHVTFPQLAALIYKSQSPHFSDLAISPYANVHHHPETLEVMATNSDRRHNHTSPDNHLACFDYLYYATSGVSTFEWKYGFSPAWRSVGRHLRFTRKLQLVTKEYMDALFPIGTSHFIAVHARRGDFDWKCGREECLPPVSAYQAKVDEIRKELYETSGIDVKQVVLMSDEPPSKFWTEVQDIGWLVVDHGAHRTVERYGLWYPTLIDVVIQSYAVGFVGTEHSTLSLVSQRRVMDWNAGVVRSINVRAKGWRASTDFRRTI